MIRSNSIPMRWRDMTKAALLPAVLLLFAAGSAFGAVQYAMTDLGTLGGSTSYAYDINNSGEVVGYSYTVAGDQHAYLCRSNGPMQDLGTLGYAPGIGSCSYACGINDGGQVVGYSTTSGGHWCAFLYGDSGPMQDLGTLGGPDSYAYGINNSGQIVGYSYTISLSNHAFL